MITTEKKTLRNYKHQITIKSTVAVCEGDPCILLLLAGQSTIVMHRKCNTVPRIEIEVPPTTENPRSVPSRITFAKSLPSREAVTGFYTPIQTLLD